MCIDYRELHKVIVNNKYLLPWIDNLFDQLKIVSVFSKIDLRSRYHKVQVVEKDIPNTIFQTKYKHYKCVMMSIGLINAFVAFIDLINRVLQNCLDKFIVVFIDNIMVYSKTYEKPD